MIYLGMKNSGLPTMVEAKSNIPKHITNTLPKVNENRFKSLQNNSLNLGSPSKTSLSTQAWFKINQSNIIPYNQNPYRRRIDFEGL